jgi:hypothetical protein
MLGASQAAFLGAAAAAITYDLLVSIFDPDVVSYWKFENDGSDERGTADATFSGSPELNVDTIVDLDKVSEGAPVDGKCIAWPGAAGVFAEVPHNAAHKTAEGTIAVTFQHDSLEEKSTLVAADRSAGGGSSGPGGLSLEVQADGSPRAFLRRQSDGQPVILVGQAGDVQLNEAYTLIFKWGQGGLSMALWNEDGSLVRRVTNVLTDGVTGTSPIRFGLWHDGTSSPHDGPYGRVIWLKRRISDGAEAILARARTIARVTGEYITTPEAHGWSTGNTVSQNTAAFNTAIANASANSSSSSTGRGVVELVQGKVYVVSAPNGVRDFPGKAVHLTASTPNVEIRTQGKPAVGGNQAVIQFQSWASQTGCRQRSLVYFENTNDCRLGWVKLDGNKVSTGSTFNARNSWLSNNLDVSQGGNGGLHNILFQGSTNCRLEQVDSANAISDGIVIRKHETTNNPLLSLQVVDCDFHHNRRQGMTVIGIGSSNLTWDQIVFRRCKFRFTGDESGVIWGQAPGAGIDLEPLQPGEPIWGLTFDDCDFLDQQGYSFDSDVGGPVSFATSRGVACDTHGNIRFFKMINCRSNGNTGEAYQLNMRDGANIEDAQLINLSASGNGNNRIGFFDAQNPPEDSRVMDTTIVNCNVASIVFENQLAPTGNNVTIWRGSFNPTVTTNGRATITINNGFPP